jgi:iron complex transport system ATP-binding protein
MTLAARALDFGFRDHVVGRGLDCALEAGEVVCLLGPNGSGKSTLMRTLLGLQARIAGEVTLDGRDLAAWGAAERARRLAWVPQAADSFFDFSLREMVEMGRTAHRGVFASPAAKDRDVAAAALDRLGIAPLADRPIHAVSGGERQLALIARALATEAGYLVMDEPTANLDYGNQARVLEEIARLKEAGIGVLVSTHHPEHAFRVADRVLLLSCGTLVAQGPTLAALTSESLSALYGRPIEVLAIRAADGTQQRVCLPAQRWTPEKSEASR